MKRTISLLMLLCIFFCLLILPPRASQHSAVSSPKASATYIPDVAPQSVSRHDRLPALEAPRGPILTARSSATAARGGPAKASAAWAWAVNAAAALTGALSPSNPVVGVTNVNLVGTATPGATVTVNETAPDGTRGTYTGVANSSGNYSMGPYKLTQLGTYTESLRDSINGATTTITYSGTGDFSTTVNTTSRTITAGQSTTYTVTFRSISGFTGVVTPAALNWSNVPGSSAFWSPSQVTVPSNGTTTATLTIQTSSGTTAGTYNNIILFGRNGSYQRAAPSVSLTVNPSTVPLTGSLSPSNPVVGVTNVNLVGTATPGATVTVNETAPDGTRGTYAGVANSSGNYSMGPYKLTQLGTYTEALRDSISGATTTITYSGTGDFSTSVNTTSRTVTAGQSTTYTVTFNSISGFTGVVTPAALNWSNVPGSSASWSPASVTVPSNGSATATLTIQTAANTTAGTYGNIILFGRNGSYQRAASAVSLTVNTATVPLTGALSPSNPVVGVTNVNLVGTATPGATVTVNETAPDGTRGTFTGVANSSGNYSMGPYKLTQLGTYTESLRDSISGATTTITYTGVGDFSTTVNANTRTITAGQSTTYTVTFTSISGFSGTVTPAALNWANVPGATASWSPSQVTVPSNGSVTATFTLQTAATTTAGTYTNIVLFGRNGSYQRAAPAVSLVVNSSTVSLTGSLSPNNPTVGVTNVNLVGTATPGATVTVSETAPDGTKGTFTGVANSSGNYSMGPYKLTQLGTYTEVLRDSISGATTTITYNGTGDFNTSVNTSSQTLAPGQSTSYTVTFTSISGFSGTVTPAALNWANVPGATALWSPTSVTVPSGGSVQATFTIQTSASTTTGEYGNIVLFGRNGSFQRAAPAVNLTVSAAALPDLTVSAAGVGGTSYTSGQSTVQSQVTISRAGGSLPVISGFPYVDARLYFSANNVWDGGDTLLWTSNGSTPDYPVSLLNSGGSKAVTATYNLPSVTAAGTYYIISVVDGLPAPNGYYAESNESNNASAYAVSVGMQGTPTVSNMTTLPSPPAGGQQFTFTLTGLNYNSSNAEVFFLGPGCPTNNSCVVSVLTRSASQLSGPATLAAGSFTVQVRNGPSSPPSNVWPLTVSAASTERADFIGETIRDGDRLAPGQKFTKTWTVRNSGTTTWNSGYRLRWQSGSNLSNHADVAVSRDVPPGSDYTFSVPMTAPASGTHREDWKFVNGAGTTIPVGSSSTVWVSINVSGGTDAASFVEETIPDDTPVTAGQLFTKSWTLRNSGTTTWGLGYKLRWISSAGANLSAHGDIFVNRQVAPGGTYTFSVLMTAPAAAGSYREDWQMVNPGGAVIRVGPSSTVWASVTVSVGGVTSTQCGTGDQMLTRIQQRIQANSYVPTYQPGESDVEALLSINLSAYDELYFSSLRYRSQIQTTFLMARKHIQQGNLEAGCQYMRRAERMLSLRTQLEGAMILVWDTRVSGAQEVTAQIISTTCSIEASLIGSRLGPAASSLADGVCLRLDYAVDKSIYGEEEAFRRLLVNIRNTVLTQVLHVGIAELGGKTLAQWMSRAGFDYNIEDSAISNLLRKALQKSETRVAIKNALIALGDATITERVDYFTDKLINSFFDGLSPGTQTNGPLAEGVSPLAPETGQAEVTHSGAPQILSTAPARSAVLVSTSTTVIEVAFSEQVQAGTLSLTMTDTGGNAVGLSNVAVQNNILTANVTTQLSPRGTYKVAIQPGAVSNAAGIPNDGYQWTFATVPPPLSVGSGAQVANTGGVGLALRSSPTFLTNGSNVTGVLPEGTRLRVVGGPQQSDGYTWWNVDANGQAGWAATGDWLTPNDTSGIRIGAQAVVSNTGGTGVILRDKPSLAGGIIATLPEGTRMTVVSGPYLVDGYVWWNMTGAAGTGFYPTAFWLLPDLNSTWNISTLTVISSNPSGGENVVISPSDVNGLGSGTGQFTRAYNVNTKVDLTAPTTTAAGSFRKWQRDSVDWSSERTTSVTMDANHVMTAVYGGAAAVQFSGGDYTASEGDAYVMVNVTRGGDLSAGGTVDYSTGDGTASERSDYTTAVGTINFAPGEATKALKIFLTDDSLSEGSEFFNLTLSNPTGGITLGTPRTAALTVIDNDAASSGSNPIDGAPFYVRQNYLDFLSRDPDPSGLSFWTGEITGCGTNTACVEVKRINVSAAFYLSIEFQETGYLVYRMHKAAFGDLPNKPVPVVRSTFLADTQTIGQGVVVNTPNWETFLENNKRVFSNSFVQRAQFTTRYPSSMSAAQFVDALNANTGGVLNSTERQNLINELSANNTDAGRAGVLRRVAEDPDLVRQEFNRAFVLMQYFGYLRRNPDDLPDRDFSGWKFWLDKLNEFNGNFVNAEMVKAFLESIEYRQRFGQ